MNRRPVTSSLIASVGYKPDRLVLEVEFKDTGSVYQYFDVPEAEFRGLMKATSLGRYFNRNIKDEYRYIQIR
jgi:KTSC domain-containing protein